MSPRWLLPALLAGTSLAPAYAQQTAAPAQDEVDEAIDELLDEPLDDEELGEEIVVTGSAPRGSVIGNTRPELTLDRREIRGYGASNIAELLDALAPQTRSGRGRGEGRPIVLLNGRRISGFAEIRDLPPEAVVRVEILPEEVALRYGYRADQRVVNFVLRRRFRAVTAETEYGLATQGGRDSYEADVNYLAINDSGRLSLDAEYEHAGALLESERDLVQAEPELARFRTLLPETDRLALNGTVNRTLFGNVPATLNGRLEMTESVSRLGLGAGIEPSDSATPLLRESDNRNAHLGFAMNGDILPWRWSLTGNYDNVHTVTRTERSLDHEDRARSTSQSADVQAVFNGPLARLPSGQVSASLRAGLDARELDSRAVRSGIVQVRDLSRQRAAAQASLDVPIASRRREVLSALGDLSLNFNAEIEQLSDFGTLTTWGAGARWSPIEEIDLAASFTDEDGAPSMQQLGDPVLLTPNVRVFDFTRGETVDISRLEGGNPELLADNRRVLNIRLNARPLSETDLNLVANYTRTRVTNPIYAFPTATPEIEAAFPERFVRDDDGRLVQVDARPVNFARADREELRWGINFSTPIGPQGPTAEQREQWREQRRQQREASGGEGVGPRTGERPRGEGARGFGGGRGFGRFGGGGMGGRLQLAFYHNWNLKDEVLIRPGVAELDFLDGSAAGNNGGRPRHELELQATASYRGFGARLSANWQSATEVRGAAGGPGGGSGDLRFSDLATLNLRLFADLGAQRALVRRHPFFRGARVTLSVGNLLDSRIRVTDSAGATPIGYQPDYLDPLGRSVRISLRKLFF